MKPKSGRRFANATVAGLKDGAKTVLWLLSIMIPVSFLVFLLERGGILDVISRTLTPAFTGVGLPGSSSLAFVGGILINLYSAIATLGQIALDLRQTTILAIASLVAHNFLVEIPILTSAGANPVRMVVLRLLGAVLAAVALSFFLPQALSDAQPQFAASRTAVQMVDASAEATFASDTLSWALRALRLALRVGLIVLSLMVAERWLHEFGVTRWLGARLRPLMRLFGLPESVGFLWVVSNTLGLAYGGGVVKREIESGALSKESGDLWCHHVALSHSLLEDTLLFVALGVPAFWITVPRLMLAILAVWERRLEYRLRRKRRH